MLKKKGNELVNLNVDLDHQVMREELKKDLKVNKRSFVSEAAISSKFCRAEDAE